METLTNYLSNKLQNAFDKCGYTNIIANVSVSDRPDLCQFQCNSSFIGAKLYHKAPILIAKEISDELSKDNDFDNIDAVAPGFINISLSDDSLVSHINSIISDSKLGIKQSDNPLNILIDYGGPNVAKPLHIGHLRAAIIGEALKRLANIMGHNAYGDIHLGDWGLQIGLVIAELSERYPAERCFSPDFDISKDTAFQPTMAELNEVYPAASKKSKSDEIFAEKAHLATMELQAGRSGYIELWKNILEASKADLKANYDKLNVSFENWLGESDAEKYIPKLISLLTDKNLLIESEGALVVNVEDDADKAKVPPIIIKKSDGASLYSTTDLATLLQRQKDFKPNCIWYVVDSRQSLHFLQVFRCAKLAGIIPNDVSLEHLGFGTMNGNDGKPFKTRDGGVMRLSDLLETVINGASDKLSNSTYVSGLSDTDKLSTAEKVGIAAIKFGDLINHRSKDYIFDIDKFLSFEGKTGTYILYTITRINSILKKLNIGYNDIKEINGIYSKAEKDLLLAISSCSDIFQKALDERAPNYLCDNAFNIASLFSSFYHDSHIIDETDPNKKNSWIALALLTRRILIMHMNVLGIDTVENM